MARLWQSGIELNSLTAGMEFTSTTGAANSISSSTVRSGGFSLRCSGLVSGTRSAATYQFAAANNTGPLYFRFYLNITTLPSATNRIVRLQNATDTTNNRIGISLTSAGALTLSDEDTANFATGPTLNTGQWYRVELKLDFTGAGGAHIVQALVDGGNLFGATNRNLSTGVVNIGFGGNLSSTAESQTQGDWFFDDIAINDSTGSFQNSYPGSGHIIHLKPSAAGDANTFAVAVGGTAGAANNFTRVNEVPPDDATSYNGSAVLAQEDLFNVDDSGIGASDTVNVVAVGGRFADLVGADATAAFKLELEKTSGGTKSQSANIVPNSTAWLTNAAAVPKNYPLVTYQDPDSSNWTQSTLDSMQIGYTLAATNVQTIAVSNVWASVDYMAASEATTTSTSSSTSSTSSSTSMTTSTSQSTSTSLSTSSTSSSTSTSQSTSTSASTSTSFSTSSTSTSASTSISTSTSQSTSTSTSTSSTSTSQSTSTTQSTSTSASTSISTSSTSSSSSSSTSISTSSTSTSQSTTTSTSSTSTSSTSSSTSSTSSSTSTMLAFDPRIMGRIRQVNWRG